MVNTRSGLETSSMVAPATHANLVLNGPPVIEEATSSHVGNEAGGTPAIEMIHAMQNGMTQMQATQAQLLAAIAGLTEVITAALPRGPPAEATQQIHAGGGVHPPELPRAEEARGTQGEAPLAGGSAVKTLVQTAIPVHPALPENPGLQTTGTGSVHQRAALGENIGPQAVTLAEVQALLQREKTRTTFPSLPSSDIQPPYPMAILRMPYPDGYTPPKFTKFDGKEGNAQEHVVRFIETLGAFSGDTNLRLREFSKSLTNRAYTWYVNLTPYSVLSWEDMVNRFYAKFFQTRERITSLSLVKETQGPSEDIIDYIRRFQDRAVDCLEPVEEEYLVEICTSGLLREYQPFLVNVKIQTFAALLEAAYKLRHTVKPPARETWKPRKSHSVAAAATSTPSSRKSQGGRSSGGRGGWSGSGNGRGDWKKQKVYKESPGAPDYPCSIEEVKALVKEWIADGGLTLPDIEVAPSRADRESPDYCMFHRHTKHPTSDCWTLKRIFKKKLDNNELRIATKAQDVRTHPYPEHGTANMAECFEFVREIEEEDYGCEYDYDYDYDYDHDYECEEAYMTSFYDELDDIAGYDTPMVATPDPESGVKILQNSTKFKQFYDGMGFTPDTRFRMTKAILAIAQEGHEACAAQGGSLPRTIKDESNAISFSDSDRRITHPHNRPLYVTARVNGVELKRAFMDGGASINIMPMSTLKKVGIPENRIVKSLIGITGFQGDKKESLGYVIVDLAVGPIRTATKFHIIDAQTNYQIILGRSWMHRFAVIPSSYHQCLKAIWAGKKVTVAASDRPFEVCEAHLSDSVYFTEMEETPTAVVARPVGVKLPKWEDIKNEGEASASKREPATESASGPRKITKVKEGGKTVYCL
jgi:hypothetical protein